MAIKDPTRCAHGNPVHDCTACAEDLKRLELIAREAQDVVQVIELEDLVDDGDDDCDEPDGEWWDCSWCGGTGTVHDCAEGASCWCEDPELDDQEPCPDCDGKGGTMVPWEP